MSIIQNIDGINMQWLGHDAFKIQADKIIYFDPYQLKTSYHDADIILITHEHYDHCSIEDIERLIKPDTVIVTTPECQSKLSRVADKVKNIILMEPGQEKEIEGIKIEAVPSYNINKFRSENIPFHPKQDGKVGFIITVNGKRVYQAGDTDFIPEMRDLKDIDIALIPVSGTYVMTANEAADAVNSFKPKIAIPMHYGSIVGNENDAIRFKNLVKENKVVVMERSQ